jgi:hypothetical protein
VSRSERARATLEAAKIVAQVLEELQVPSALIGAMALAAHNYPRATQDVDLGTDADPYTDLRLAKLALEKRGFMAELVTPDMDDPLGGVINVQREGLQRIQVVNFYNPHHVRIRTPGLEAIRTAAPMGLGGGIRVVDLPHLIALKLYAGGGQSMSDVSALLERNAPVDLEPIRDVCRRFQLDAPLEKLLKELQLA